MESTYHIEESTNSSEEIMDHSDQENSDLGMGRSYECVFCKRGFNTAQALGGHMNIHRKDRARNKPNSNSNSNSSTKHEESYSGPRFYEKIPSLGLGFHRLSDPQHHHQPHLDYATYFPSPASSNSTLYESNYGSDRYGPRQTEAVGHDWRMRLGLVEDGEKNQEKELDLELRLGYDS